MKEEYGNQGLSLAEKNKLKKFFEVMKKRKQMRETKCEDFREYIECKRAFSLFRKWRRQNKRIIERNEQLALG